MTNLEFLRTASRENVARFLVTFNEGMGPKDWYKAMQQMITFLEDRFDDGEFEKTLRECPD